MNKIVYECIKDNIYLPRLKEYKIRNTARCILLNDKNEICLLLIDRDDDFGKMKHFETPGGGVEKGETLIDALKREMKEEVGYLIKDINYLCEISNEYNLIGRIDNATFFIARTLQRGEKHLDEYEKGLIKGHVWIPILEYKKYYEQYPPFKVSHIIYERDQKVIELAIKYLKEKNLV